MPRSSTYLNNRHYDPTTGVFTSVDPLVTQTMQPYIYGAANPVRFSDPSGLEPRPIHCKQNCGDPGPDPYASGCGGYGCGSYVPNNHQGPLAPNQGRARPGWRPPVVIGGSPASPIGSPPAYAPNATWDCGPPSGPATAQTPGNCGWTGRNPNAPALPSRDASFADIVPRSVVDFAKNYGIAMIAVAGGVAFCGATAGVGCIVVASAAIGAGANVLASEGVDCIYGSGSYGQFDDAIIDAINDAINDAVAGAVIGGTSGYVRTNLSIQLGSSNPAIGVFDAAGTYGAGQTAVAASTVTTEIALSQLTRMLIER